MTINSKSVIRITAVIFSGLMLLTGCGNNKELSPYEQGIEKLSQESYVEALELFKAEEASPGKDMKLVYRAQGLAMLGLGQYDEAIDAFTLALSQGNGLIEKVDYDINFYIGVAEYKSGKLEDAVKTYSSILAVDKNNAEAYYLRGKVNLLLGRENDAKDDYNRAIALDKDNSKLYVNIYKDLYDYGLTGDAKGYINSGVASVSKPTQYELGIFNYYLEDYTQARNYFEQSSETKKTEEGIVYLAKTYEALDDANYAAALYEEYAANNKTAAIVYNELGLLRANNKDYEGAAAAFESGIQCENSSCRQTLMYNRIVANEFLGNFDIAKSQMEEYLSLYPGDEAALRENIFLSTR